MEKTEGEILKEKLFNSKKSGWEGLSETDTRNVFKFADEYMFYLNQAKTEKEIVYFSKDILLKNDFKDLKDVESVKPRW